MRSEDKPVVGLKELLPAATPAPVLAERKDILAIVREVLTGKPLSLLTALDEIEQRVNARG